ncbi:MAG TPA: lysylphosphatidylglycerol synthase transmembrane domain-containing protein [Solirubrobacteraceae bacterium]
MNGIRREGAAELALPQLDVRELARRAALPAALAAAAAGALIVAGGPLRAFADALNRALAADWRWVAAGAAFELLSFAGYVALLWLVAGRATPRIDARRAVEVTLGGAAATRLLPTAGAGGAALTLWALRRTGMGTAKAARTLLTFLVLLYAVFLGAIAASGAFIALGAVRATGPLTLSALPAGAATIGIVVPLGLGLHRRGAGADAALPAGRLRRGARLLGDATADAIALLRTADPRLLGALAWWLFDGAVLWAMLNAFGAPPALAVVVLAYFVGQVGNTIPIPGAVSGGIVGVLLAFGVDADLALIAVLAYRAVAIWLPAPVGLIALTSLRRTLARWAREDAPAPARARRRSGRLAHPAPAAARAACEQARA